jgi:tetratricopeptide (TPR) repeat protein
MKKIVFIASLACMGVQVSAQTPDKANEFLKTNQLDKAKESIDQAMANPKNQKSVEAWYTKSKVYSAVSADKKFSSLAPNAGDEAVTALNEAMKIDSNKALLSLLSDKYAPIQNTRAGYASQFETSFAAEKWDEALTSLKKIDDLSAYSRSKGWNLYPEVDTMVCFYTGYAAMKGKKDDEAVKYFNKLASTKAKNSPDFLIAYEYLAKYYYDKKDEANFYKATKVGKELYPKENYWTLLELDYLGQKGDKAALYAKYDEVLTADPNNYDVTLDYANALFNDTHTGDLKSKAPNYAENNTKIETLYKKAIELKPDNNDIKLSLGKHYFNQALALDDQIAAIKGKTPEDTKKKADLNAQAVALCDKAIPNLEAYFTEHDSHAKMKTSEKSNFKTCCNLLVYCYDKKKNTEKSKFYQKKYDDADTAH